MADEQQRAGGLNAGAGEEAVHCIQLPIPKPFDGRPESWPKWRQRFELYRINNGLDETKEASTFLYSTGDVAYDILATLNVDESTRTYTNFLATFDTHFAPRKNVIFGRIRFN